MTGDEMVPHIERALRYVGDQSSAAPILRTVLKTHREDKRRERAAAAQASQGGLFADGKGEELMASGVPYRPYSNTTTSLEAAAAKKDATAQRERIFKMVEASHSNVHQTRLVHLPARHAFKVGLTADEIDEYTGLGGDTIRPRLKDLEKQRRIYKSELQRRTRKGRFAHIWKLVDPGPRP